MNSEHTNTYETMSLTPRTPKNEKAFYDGLQKEFNQLKVIEARQKIKEEKRAASKAKQIAYQKEYQAKNKQKMREYALSNYYNNEEYRKNKRLSSAYKRYMAGSIISNKLVDDLLEAGYVNIEYRRPEYNWQNLRED